MLAIVGESCARSVARRRRALTIGFSGRFEHGGAPPPAHTGPPTIHPASCLRALSARNFDAVRARLAFHDCDALRAGYPTQYTGKLYCTQSAPHVYSRGLGSVRVRARACLCSARAAIAAPRRCRARLAVETTVLASCSSALALTASPLLVRSFRALCYYPRINLLPAQSSRERDTARNTPRRLESSL